MYVQIFHSGAIEGVGSFPLDSAGGGPAVWGVALEMQLLEAIPPWFRVQENLGVVPPIMVMIALVGMEGIRLINDRFWADGAQPIRNEIVRLPPVEISSFFEPLPPKLRNAFDRMWQEAGYPGSPSYSSAGEERN
jgi:hypothetical protein